jgi:uncharacterized protein with von Willebrand factor type A (vWA) domain
VTARSPGELVVTRLSQFGCVLRAGGLEVGPGRIQDALLALRAVDIGSRQETYWALRCTLVSKHADLETFDQAFARFYDEARSNQPSLDGGDETEEPEPRAEDEQLPRAPDRLSADSAAPGEAQDEEPQAEEAGMRWSAVERLRALDFARYTDAELQEASRLVQRIARSVPLRSSRRLRTAADGPVFDKRRTLRAAMRTDGYPIERSWRRPRLVPRKLVFVVDVSGSMQPYARAMVMFMQAAVRAGRRVEAFTFGTRLTRVTRELEGRNPDRALAAATRVVPDWAGGTRIGSNLQALNDEWGPRGLTRGAVVVIVSDGWERGDIPRMVEEMQRLARMTHTLVWVNPLAGEPGYEPLAQGMAAALPYIDHFLPGHNLNSLAALAEILESLPSRGRHTERAVLRR